MNATGRRSRGGYRPDSRLATVRDEIAMEMMGAVRGSLDERRAAVREACRLARQYVALLDCLNREQPEARAA